MPIGVKPVAPVTGAGWLPSREPVTPTPSAGVVLAPAPAPVGLAWEPVGIEMSLPAGAVGIGGDGTQAGTFAIAVAGKSPQWFWGAAQFFSGDGVGVVESGRTVMLLSLQMSQQPNIPVELLPVTFATQPISPDSPLQQGC